MNHFNVRSGLFDVGFWLVQYQNVKKAKSLLQFNSIFWKTPSEKPAPLVFVIHGGGWNCDSKELLHRFVDTAALLEKDISVVATRP